MRRYRAIGSESRDLSRSHPCRCRDSCSSRGDPQRPIAMVHAAAGPREREARRGVQASLIALRVRRAAIRKPTEHARALLSLDAIVTVGAAVAFAELAATLVQVRLAAFACRCVRHEALAFVGGGGHGEIRKVFRWSRSAARRASYQRPCRPDLAHPRAPPSTRRA